MMTKGLKLVTILLLLTLAGCANLPINLGSILKVGTTMPEAVPSATSPATPVVEETLFPTTPEGTVAATQPTEETILRIWLPAEFDPQGASPASGILRARLEDFAAENPGLRLEVRIKSLDGEGGLVESLVAASAAAPMTLPDIVLLPRPLLESAALKGLLYPYNGLTDIMDDKSWFDYAHQLGRIKDNIYGIPFAADALALANRPSLLETTPSSLEGIIALGDVLIYPATDPQALFTLCMYQAETGSLQDAQGRPSLEVSKLANIFQYYQRASLAGVMPSSLTQYSNDAQVWEAFLGGEYPLAITWVSTYLEHKLSVTPDLALSMLPTPDGTPFSLATGWSWALAGQEAGRRSQAIQLAQYLVDKDFMGKWTYAAGYLPPRTDALQTWPVADSVQVIEQISSSAQLMPPADLIATIGPALEQAVNKVIKAQSDPQTAAREAISQINKP